MLARFLPTLLLLSAALAAFGANPPVAVSVDASANRHAIDPRIYGAAWASSTQISQLGLTLNRWGGNAMSRYNWTYSTANRCKDYYFYNIPEGGTNGASADAFIQTTRNAGAQPVMTIPMLSLLPKDATKRCSFPLALYPGQEEYSCCEPITCGNGRLQDGNGIAGDGPRILGNPDPNNISTSYPLSHQGDWVQHMIDTWGNAASGGMRYYSLDNEPGLWSFDHWDVHPGGTTYDEAWAKMSELGAIIRAKDAGAVITGGEEWGWSGYFWSGADVENGDEADYTSHGNTFWYDWMLDQFKQYETDHGTRILDVLTVHFYPQSGEFWSGSVETGMQLLRNRSTRALWDPEYIDESWIRDTCFDGCRVQLIPRLKEWVANHYPGTQIGITEYNWGDVDHINGATTQADILGIFGREGLDLATRWTAPGTSTFEGSAFRIYRNYDGAGSKFGDTSVSASGPNPDEVAVFAAQRASDQALTIMLIAKTLSGDTPATVNLAGFANGRTVQRWQLSAASRNIAHLSDVAISSPSVSLTLPPQTITLLVIPKAAVPGAPAIGTATPGNGSASIAFTAPASDGGSNVTGYTVTCNPGAITGSGATSPVTVTGLTNGVQYSCSVQALNAAGTGPASTTVNVTPASGAPTLTATAAGTSQVDLTWTAVAGATGYELWRSFHNGAYVLRTTTGAATTSLSDGGLAANTTYLYKVRALTGGPAGPFSAIDPATTILFTDPTLAGRVRVKTAHFSQLRTAVNAMRTAAGLAAQSFTDDPLSSAIRIKAVHLTQLRTALDQARAAIGLPAAAYAETITAHTTRIKAVHVTELRNGVK
jgi:Glycoside hydrolase family 44/Fibronectin type III domain